MGKWIYSIISVKNCGQLSNSACVVVEGVCGKNELMLSQKSFSGLMVVILNWEMFTSGSIDCPCRLE